MSEERISSFYFHQEELVKGKRTPTPVRMTRWIVLSSLSFLKMRLVSLFTTLIALAQAPCSMHNTLTPLAFIDHEHLPSGRLLEYRGEILTSNRFVCRHEHMVFSTGCSFDEILVVQLILLDNITSSSLSVE